MWHRQRSILHWSWRANEMEIENTMADECNRKIVVIICPMTVWETVEMIWALSPFAMIADFLLVGLWGGRCYCTLCTHMERYGVLRFVSTSSTTLPAAPPAEKNTLHQICVVCTFPLLKQKFSVSYILLACSNFSIIKYFYKLYFIVVNISFLCHFVCSLLILHIKRTFGHAMCWIVAFHCDSTCTYDCTCVFFSIPPYIW